MKLLLSGPEAPCHAGSQRVCPEQPSDCDKHAPTPSLGSSIPPSTPLCSPGGSSQPTGREQKAVWTRPALLFPRSFLSRLSLQGSCFNQSQEMKIEPEWSCPTCPPLTFRVRPEEVTHGSIVRHFLLSINRPDLVQSLDGGGKAPMHTEDLEGRARPEGREAQVHSLLHHSSPKESHGQPTLPSMMADRLR